MISVSYDIPESLRTGTLGPPVVARFAAAQDALSRLDERARRSPYRESWMQRLLFHEACACQLFEGDLVHLEDLVLFDGDAYSGAPSMGLSSALEILKVWRAAERGDAVDALIAPRPGLAGCNPVAGSVSEARDEDAPIGSPAHLEAWRRIQDQTHRVPPLIAAAIAWDAWVSLLPETRSAWRATLLAALTLKARDATPHLLVPLDIGWRHSTYRRREHDDFATRIGGFLAWVEAAALEGQKEFDSLVLAEGLLAGNLRRRRASSRMPKLARLLLDRPFVSAAMAASALGVSRQGAHILLKQIGAPAHRLTDRKRCNVWSLIG